MKKIVTQIILGDTPNFEKNILPPKTNSKKPAKKQWLEDGCPLSFGAKRHIFSPLSFEVSIIFLWNLEQET